MEFIKSLCLGGITTTMLLSGCTQKNITLEGKVTNTSGAPIVYNITTDGIYLPNKIDTLRLNADSTYQITLPVNGNEKLTLFLYGERNLGSIYLAPGKQTLDIDASKSNELNPVDGLTKENEILKKLADLNENVFNLRARRGDIFNVGKDTVASSVYQKLTDYATTLENEVAEVDDQLRQRAIQDIRIQALMAYMNQYFGNYRRGSETLKKEWDDAYAQMLDFANVGQAESVFSPAFADVVSNMAGIDIFMKHERRTNDDNERNQLLFDWYKTNLQGRVQEAAMGLLILEDESREYFATGIPALYEEFKTLYPKSVLMPKLETAIQRNKAFNEAELPKDIHILNTDSVRTFKEITDLYTFIRGQQLSDTEQTGLYFFSMTQHIRLLFQFLLFTCRQICFFQLLQLETDIVFICLILLSTGYEVCQFLLCLLPFSIQRLISRKLFIIMRQYIEYIQLESFFIQQKILVLRMHVN